MAKFIRMPVVENLADDEFEISFYGAIVGMAWKKYKLGMS